MSKNVPPRPGSARRAASASAKAKAAQQRRTRWIIGAAAAVVVVAALVIAIVVNSGGGSSSSSATTLSPAATAAVVAKATAVPASTLAAVGQGSATAAPKPVQGTPISVGGKPEVLYVGAEYCPFCAAERWPMLVALSKFGTFTGVGVTHSSSIDVYPNTATLTFHGATFVSDYLAFTPVEVATNQPDGSGGYTRLDTPTAEQQAIVTELSPKGSIPFVDLGGKFLISGASYSPDVLAGHSATEIADALSSPNSDIAKSVLGAANGMIAAICQLTGNQPAATCTPSG